MTKRQLRKQLKEFSHKTEATTTLYSGALGIYIGGHQYVDVPNRPGFVYVRLRNNTSELIQAHNEVVSPVYGLPVILVRNKTYYEIYGRDSVQYASYWDSSSSYLPKHGSQHEFDPNNNGGGDLVFVHGEQFYPMMTFPSGTDGGNTVLIAPYRYYYSSAWHYAGDTGAGNLLQYGPTGASNAKLLLVGIDATTGNPFVKLGSEFDASITGAAAMTSYVPTNITQSTEIPGAIVRLVTGTSTITWANIYDARQYMGILQAAGGATDFLGLSDTPNSYSGQADKLVVVNSAANALEFRTNTGTSGGGGPLTILRDFAGLTAGDNNNYNPTGYDASTDVIAVFGDAGGTSTITGLVGGTEGRVITITNIGGYKVTLDNQGSSSSAGNRFEFNGIESRTLYYGESITLYYDNNFNQVWYPMDMRKENDALFLNAAFTYGITGSITDWNNFNLQYNSVFLLNSSGTYDIGGIYYVGNLFNEPSQVLTFVNIGSNTLTFKNENGPSTAAYRFSMGNDVQLSPGKSLILWYDNNNSRWRNIAASPSTFLNLTDTPDSYSGQGSKFVAVKSDASGLEFVTAPAGGGGGSNLVIYDDGVYKATGTSISFDANLTVIASGSSVFVAGAAGGGGGGGSGVVVYDDSVYKVTGTAISFDSNLSVAVTGSVAYVSVGAGALLGYNLGISGTSSAAYTITSASLADVDATYMAVTFIAPPSGNVLVRLSASTAPPGGTLDAYEDWGIRESTTNIAGAIGTSLAARTANAASSPTYIGATKVFIMKGISAGLHTYKWSAASSVSGAIIKAGPNSPAVMEVWSLP